VTPEAGVKVVFFPLIAGAAEGLQVADVVLTTTGKRNDVIDCEVSFSVRFTAAFALVLIAFKNIFPHLGRNVNPGRFTHELLC
jgi:hypothetical protein